MQGKQENIYNLRLSAASFACTVLGFVCQDEPVDMLLFVYVFDWLCDFWCTFYSFILYIHFMSFLLHIYIYIYIHFISFLLHFSPLPNAIGLHPRSCVIQSDSTSKNLGVAWHAIFNKACKLSNHVRLRSVWSCLPSFSSLHFCFFFFGCSPARKEHAQPHSRLNIDDMTTVLYCLRFHPKTLA